MDEEQGDLNMLAYSLESLSLVSKTLSLYQFELVVGSKGMMVAGVSEVCCSGSESDNTSEGEEPDQDVDYRPVLILVPTTNILTPGMMIQIGHLMIIRT